jgi:predicted house-cleaning noncanonical NTP pyrophosphatase (MazG superfamily)
MDFRNVKYEVQQLTNDDYKEKLDEKLQEELKEYLEASNEEQLAELADLVEVIYAIVINSGSTIEQFEQIRKKKQEERGGFESKLLLISTES